MRSAGPRALLGRSFIEDNPSNVSLSILGRFCRQSNPKFSYSSKVGGEKIRSVDAIKALVTMCDMTHKSLYFEEKLELRGNSHKMMEIIAIVDERV